MLPLWGSHLHWQWLAEAAVAAKQLCPMHGASRMHAPEAVLLRRRQPLGLSSEVRERCRRWPFLPPSPSADGPSPATAGDGWAVDGAATGDSNSGGWGNVSLCVGFLKGLQAQA